MLKAAYLEVFPRVELEQDNETEIVASWLVGHGMQQPSNRVKQALKSLFNRNQIATVFQDYMEQMRELIIKSEVGDDLQKLVELKRVFEFPLYYLNLSQEDILYFQRNLNSLLRHKVTERMEFDPEFMDEIGLDCEVLLELRYEELVKQQVSTIAYIWNKSFINEIDDNEIAYRELSKLRISEIFEIVVNYPHSVPALTDLKLCLLPAQRQDLVTTFINECNAALLHAGANTNDIIGCYMSTIKSFLLVDPRGVLLDHASRPMRKYLRERKDTIATVVSALLKMSDHPKISSLADELTKTCEGAEDAANNDFTLSWCPDPIDALPDFKKTDVIESLITIFDSKEAFINEFSQVFASLLLKLDDYDCSEAAFKLSQLKKKFGDEEFQNLDVMFKDIKDSAVVNKEIHEHNADISEALQFSILSYMYWPEGEQPEQQFRLPKQITKQIQRYEDSFAKLKRKRKLQWINAGVVTLELEVGGQMLVFKVTPDKAAVIHKFSEIDGFLLKKDLEQSLEMSAEMLDSAIEFWVSNSVLRVEDDRVYANE